MKASLLPRESSVRDRLKPAKSKDELDRLEAERTVALRKVQKEKDTLSCLQDLYFNQLFLARWEDAEKSASQTHDAQIAWQNAMTDAAVLHWRIQNAEIK